MNSDYFVVYPEIISEVIKNKEDDVFLLWLISKDIDNANSGIIDIKSLISFGNKMFGLRSNYIYSKIEKGTGLYWRKPFGKHGKRQIGLLSINNITKRLKPKVTRVQPVLLPKTALNGTSKELRELLISIVAGRYHDSRPLSFYSLIGNLGISESAIRNAIKNCVYINTKTNHQVIAEDHSRERLCSIMQSTKEPWAHKILMSDNKYKLVRQSPNSYELIFKRLPIKKRPDELKRNDKLLFAILEPKRYHQN